MTKRLKCWKKTGTLDDYTFFETKKRSKYYPKQPADYITVRKHLLNPNKWVASRGEAEAFLPLFNTEKKALSIARGYMEEHDSC